MDEVANMPKLTKAFVDSQEHPASGQVFFWDEEVRKLGLRSDAHQKDLRSPITETNTAETKRMTLGSLGELTPAQASD